MSTPLLDLRFGWRWMLPALTSGGLRLYGFSTEEVEFWRQAWLSAGLDDKSGVAYVLMVDAEHCGAQDGPRREDLSVARLVCVLASRRQARYWRSTLRDAFPRVCEYGLLPVTNPRLVVPLSSCSRAAQALSLHWPGRWMARAVVLAARLLARIGSLALLRGRVLLIATRSKTVLPSGVLQAGLTLSGDAHLFDYALYLGTPDDNRKTVVLPLGPSAPGTILKVAQTPRARASLDNEAGALAVLSRSALATSVPSFIDRVVSGQVITLHQEFRPRRWASQERMHYAVVEFLVKLALLERRSAPLLSLLPSVSPADRCAIPEAVSRACRVVRERLQVLAESGAEIWQHRTHGDFAPWNCAWTAQGLFVFDWEESREQGLALGDAFYYVIAPALLVQRNLSAAKTLEAALSMASRVAEASGGQLDSRVYLALWLLRQVGKADLYGELMVLLERGWP